MKNHQCMLMVLCIIAGVILALIPHILWIFGWIGCKLAGTTLQYRHFGIAALVIVLLFWTALAYGYFRGRWNVESVGLEYCHQNIPEAFDGFKIVHISDLHLSTFDDAPQRLNTFVDEINKHKPDLVCFTGDMVTVGRSEAEPYTDVLRRISATHGVVSVLGNHDFMIYRFRQDDERENAVEDLADYQKNILGWTLLRNENRVIETQDGSKITLLGVDNANFENQGFRTIHEGDLKKAMEGTGGFRILLTHDPSHWTAEVLPEADIPLTLSGHTHSAQIRILGWTPARWSFNEIAGRYDNGGKTLYVNVGLGCTAPFRIGVNPEVTVITLKSDKQGNAYSEK